MPVTAQGEMWPDDYFTLWHAVTVERGLRVAAVQSAYLIDKKNQEIAYELYHKNKEVFAKDADNQLLFKALSDTIEERNNLKVILKTTRDLLQMANDELKRGANDRNDRQAEDGTGYLAKLQRIVARFSRRKTDNERGTKTAVETDA